MSYQVLATKEIDKDLSKLHPSDRIKVIETINKLSDPFDPYLNLKVKKMIETENFWRIRIGKIRIIYEIDDKLKAVIIRRIAYRGHAYRL